MDKIRNFWETLTIKNKIAVFTISVFVALALAVLFDAWVVKLFTKDFNDIMEDNSSGGEIVNAIKHETDAFDEYIRGTGSTDDEAWAKSVEATRQAIYAVPLDYTHLEIPDLPCFSLCRAPTRSTAAKEIR